MPSSPFQIVRFDQTTEMTVLLLQDEENSLGFRDHFQNAIQHLNQSLVRRSASRVRLTFSALFQSSSAFLPFSSLKSVPYSRRSWRKRERCDWIHQCRQGECLHAVKARSFSRKSRRIVAVVIIVLVKFEGMKGRCCCCWCCWFV